MQVTSQPSEWRVLVQLDNDAEEATYVYDLIHSGRLQVDKKESLPLPFHGQYLFKLPDLPRPIAIQVARSEPTATEKVKGGRGVKLFISCAKGPDNLLAELERALREVPRASEEEFKSEEAKHQ